MTGLAGPRLDAFVLAVNEIMTNAVRHGGGSGRIRLWRTAAGLACEISDEGTGAPMGVFNGHQLPPMSATGGRGLWLARHLCDSMDVESGSAGTTVHLTMTI
jgi:anti-sigma regulatory factor (Ser/Thr protein kinase)